MDYEYDALVGGQIKKFRENLELTQEQLAAKMQIAGCLSITRSTLAKIEAGQRHIYAIELKNFATVLHVSYEDLFV